MASKVCKLCEIEKDIDDFKKQSRICKRCIYNKNNTYMKNYYEQHKERLIAVNSKRYYEKNPVRSPKGRPVIHKIKNDEDEIEKVLNC